FARSPAQPRAHARLPLHHFSPAISESPHQSLHGPPESGKDPGIPPALSTLPSSTTAKGPSAIAALLGLRAIVGRGRPWYAAHVRRLAEPASDSHGRYARLQVHAEPAADRLLHE